jgi:crotonobetainyl-CoA:carnitine CoA-transferase CaiB-like acyl-CoA transferase
MTGPLNGVKVLDIGAYAVGPGATAYLGFLGADVIRIEGPNGDGLMDADPMMNGMGPSYINANLHKKNITLNLKDDKDLKTAHSLARWADILIENRLPGVAERLGLGYQDVATINPKIIYISSPGFGSAGPYAKAPALDQYIQILSGFASIQGQEGGKGELFRAIGHLDWNTSASIVQAAILGLIYRHKTNIGQRIEVWHYSTALFLQITRIAEFFATSATDLPLGSASTIYAPSQSFKCLDNKYINITITNDQEWYSLCKALTLDEKIIQDKRFSSNNNRIKNRSVLANTIESRTQEGPAWWWIKHLRKHEIVCGPIYELQDIIRDPHVQDQQLIIRIDTAWGKLLHSSHPWKFSETNLDPIQGTHKPGQDKEEVIKIIKDL